MPNIPGFSQLMAMLFAPKIEIHRDESETRYCSLLCGLGYKENKKKKVATPLFAEHDLVLKFDCYMDQDDMLQINKLRYTMSALLHINVGERLPDLKPDDVLRLKKEANLILIRFLRKERKFIDERTSEAREYQWGAADEDELQLADGTQMYGEQAIFPSFSFMKLQIEAPEEVDRLRDNNQELYAIAFW